MGPKFGISEARERKKAVLPGAGAFECHSDRGQACLPAGIFCFDACINIGVTPRVMRGMRGGLGALCRQPRGCGRLSVAMAVHRRKESHEFPEHRGGMEFDGMCGDR